MGRAEFDRGQRELLESMAKGAPLPQVLLGIVTLVEQQAEDMLCSVMLLEKDAVHIRTGAARTLPAAYMAQLDGLAIGPRAGSCGTAAYTGERVIVEDIATHPNWASYRDLALPYGLRACWSSPILSSTKTVLGTFAMYHREPHRPTDEERHWVDDATHLAAVAIERDRDLKRLREAEEARRANETRRAFVYDCVEDIIFYVGVEGPEQYRFLSVNHAFEKATGLPVSDVVGKLITEVIPAVSHEKVLSRYAEAIAQRARVTWEEISPYPTGTKHGSVAICPIFDALGVCTNIVGTVHDITERVKAQAEKDEAQARLYQAQRLQALGTLAGGVAHDFNNMLSVILSYASLTAEQLPPDEPLRVNVDEIQRAAERATEMTRQLLAFSRQQVLSPRVLDLNRSVMGMERMLQRLLGADIVLTVLAAPKLSNVHADPGQLEQIVMNLAVNARDAMPRGGKLTIETSNVVLDEACASKRVEEVPPGRYVMVAVTDDGVGMDAATQARIFEPFFTTKENGKGTGLGLATVFGIVKQSGGHIWVHSEPGCGTTFKLYLPAVDSPTDEALPPSAAPAAPKGGRTILLVEDDEQVRAVATTVLRQHGYTVLAAANAGEALLICEQREVTIDLLLTDVVMPRMSGPQLAERLRAVQPEIKVLFVSGYTDDAILHHGAQSSPAHCLQKPITPGALLRKVGDVIAG